MINAVSSRVGYSLNEINKTNKQESVQASDAKSSKLSALSRQLESGEYKVDLKQLAGKIADELI